MEYMSGGTEIGMKASGEHASDMVTAVTFSLMEINTLGSTGMETQMASVSTNGRTGILMLVSFSMA